MVWCPLLNNQLFRFWCPPRSGGGGGEAISYKKVKNACCLAKGCKSKILVALRVFRTKQGKRLSLHMSQVAHQAGAYPSFSSMKRLEVFLLPPGWDTSPSQG